MAEYKWRHFEGDVILWAVRWYCRYPISYRALEEMLAERAISVDHTTIYRWGQCYAPEMEDRKSGVLGKSVSVRVDHGGRRCIKQTSENKETGHRHRHKSRQECSKHKR